MCIYMDLGMYLSVYIWIYMSSHISNDFFLAFPFSRVLLGGLGDVAGALPKALARRGHRVMVNLYFLLNIL